MLKVNGEVERGEEPELGSLVEATCPWVCFDKALNLP